MIVMIIIAALFYILAGTLYVSNIYIRIDSSEEGRKYKEAISNRNSKVIVFLLTVGAILGIIWVFSLHISFIIGIGVLLGAFLIGVFIRIIIHKKRS